MREAEKKRLVKLIEEAHKKSAEAIHEMMMDTVKTKGRFNSKTDADRQSIYEIEADYLLENGVIVPPCKAGQTVWVLGSEYFWEAQIVRIDTFIWEDKKETIIYFVYSGESELNMIDSRLIGKEMFFSKAEAEYALKNRRSVSLVNGHIEE